MTVAVTAISLLAPLSAHAFGPDDWHGKDASKHEEKRENRDKRDIERDREKLAQDRARLRRDDRDGDAGRRGDGPPPWAVAAGRRDPRGGDDRRDDYRDRHDYDDNHRYDNRRDNDYRDNHDRDRDRDWQRRYDDAQVAHRQNTKNEWRNLGYAAAAAAVYGVLKHDNTITFAGLAGALYSASRYEQDRRSQSDESRARVALFDQGWFERDGVRYSRRETWRDGQKYYYFCR